MVACVTSSKCCPSFYDCGQRGSLLSVARWCPVSFTHNYLSLSLSLSRSLSSIFQFIFEAWETTIINTAAICSLSIIACAMIASVADSHGLDISGAVSFREVWVHHIYPVIQPMYDVLKLLPSSRMTAKQTEREKTDKKEQKGWRGHHSPQTIQCPG